MGILDFLEQAQEDLQKLIEHWDEIAKKYGNKNNTKKEN